MIYVQKQINFTRSRITIVFKMKLSHYNSVQADISLDSKSKVYSILFYFILFF